MKTPKKPESEFDGLKRAVDAGNASAEDVFRLARLYYRGEGVAANKAMAVNLFQQAADNGDGYAAFDAADMYRDGDGVPKELNKACEYYKKAKEIFPTWGLPQQRAEEICQKSVQKTRKR